MNNNNDKKVPHDDPVLVEHYKDILQLFPQAEIIRDKDETLRFRRNKVIDYVVQCSHDIPLIDLNQIGRLYHSGLFSVHDVMEYYMLMGYSLCGFEEVFGNEMDEMLGKEK